MFSKIISAIKRNAKALIRLGLLLVYSLLILAFAKKVGDVLMFFAAWCFVEFVLAKIKKAS